MIAAEVKSGAVDRLVRQLHSHGERLAERRANTIARQISTNGHPWRSASALWPDLGLER